MNQNFPPPVETNLNPSVLKKQTHSVYVFSLKQQHGKKTCGEIKHDSQCFLIL